MSNSRSSLILILALLATVPMISLAASALDIVSDKLEMDERTKQATFSGNVLATDQDMKLSAQRMVVHYFGDDNQNNKGIKDIKADGNVVIRVGEREGRGDSALYKVPENVLELTSTKGKASVQRGDDRLEGKRIVFYLTKDRKVEKVSAQGGGGRVSARILPSESGGGRSNTNGKE